MLVHEHTQTLLDRGISRSVHGVLISGPTGAGKGHVAKYYASRVLELDTPELIDQYPYAELIAPQNGSITIEQIRNLQRFLQLKTPGNAGIRRVAIIEDAHQMTTEAQNALLKSLEEPPADTLVILTAPATKQLKETIYSRVQQIPILPVTKKQALAHYSTTHDQAAISKAYAMSSGHTGLLHALLHDTDHALVAQIQLAKEIISGTTFERLARVDEISKQKESLPLFLQACKLICSTALAGAAQKTSTKQIQHWHKALDAVYRAEAALPRNPNAKLLLTDLMFNL